MSLYTCTALNKTTKPLLYATLFHRIKSTGNFHVKDLVLLLWRSLKGVGAVPEVRIREHEKRPPKREA